MMKAGKCQAAFLASLRGGFQFKLFQLAVIALLKHRLLRCMQAKTWWRCTPLKALGSTICWTSDNPEFPCQKMFEACLGYREVRQRETHMFDHCQQPA